MQLTKKANAKINLTLDLTGTLPDGYHAIYTVMQSVTLHDTVTAETCVEAGIRLDCDAPGVPTDERNTAYKAAALFYREIGETPRLRLTVQKRIPSQAGLGGGSADAAAVLRILNEIHGFCVPEANLRKIALKIGADVPFCITGGTRLCLNKGEVLAKLEPYASNVLIVKPAAGVSTAEAYRKFDAAPVLTHPDNDRVLFHFAMGDYETGLGYAGNLFEQLVSLPEGAAVKKSLRDHGAFYASMSGSGAAFFGLFREKAAAEAAQAALAGRGLFTCLCGTAAAGVE